MSLILRTSVFAFASAAVASLSLAGPFGRPGTAGGSLQGSVRSMIQQKIGPGGGQSWKNPSKASQPDWKTRGDIFGQPNGPGTGSTGVGKPLKKPFKPLPGSSTATGQTLAGGSSPTTPVTVQATPPMQGPPGYVFENGAWKRVKAGTPPTTPTGPITATAAVRDHRPTETGRHSGTGWKYGQANYGPGKPLTGSDISGGVQVTNGPPRDVSGATHYGEGPGLHTLIDLFTPKGFSAPNEAARDHRDRK